MMQLTNTSKITTSVLTAKLDQINALARMGHDVTQTAIDMLRFALNAPQLYSFGDLLQHDFLGCSCTSRNTSHNNIIAFTVSPPESESDESTLPMTIPEMSPEVKPYVELMRIFAYGSYAEYVEAAAAGNAATMPSPEADLKLRLLTLTSLAGKMRVISYDDVIDVLSMTDDCCDDEGVERHLTAAIRRRLIVGRLDAVGRRFHVESVAAVRDMDLSTLPDVMRRLQRWSDACCDFEPSLAA